jgi:uncharacterized protein (DUF433 family)
MKLTRITVDPAVCTGKPCIRGLRFPAARLLGLLAITRDQILADYPYLEPDDINEALRLPPCSLRMKLSNWQGEISYRYALAAGLDALARGGTQRC